MSGGSITFTHAITRAPGESVTAGLRAIDAGAGSRPTRAGPRQGAKKRPLA